MLKKILLSCFVFTLGFIALEASLRLLGFPSNSPFIQYDPSTYWRMAPNQSFSFIDEYGEKAHVTINKRGARGENFSKEKPPGQKRLITVGDSFTYGWGVDDQATYQAFLEEKLREKALNWDVINLGCNGHTILHELGMVRSYGLPLDPDAVLVGFTMTDFTDIDEIDLHLKSMPTPGYNAAKYLIRKTALGHLILNIRTKAKQRQIQNRREGQPEPEQASILGVSADKTKELIMGNRTVVQVYQDRLAELVSLGREEGFQVIFLVLPNAMENMDALFIEGRFHKGEDWPLEEFLNSIEKEHGDQIKIVSLVGKMNDPDLFLADFHLNAKGNKRAAQILFDALGEDFWSPPLLIRR